MPVLLWEAWQKGPCIFNLSRISALTRSSAVDPPPFHWLLTLIIVSHMASHSHNGRHSVSGLLYWLYPELSAPPHALCLIILMASNCLFLIVKSRSLSCCGCVLPWGNHWSVPPVEDIYTLLQHYITPNSLSSRPFGPACVPFSIYKTRAANATTLSWAMWVLLLR